MWKSVRIVIWAAIALLFISSLFLTGLQTNYAKERIRLWLIDLATIHGMELSIGAIEGGPPLRWTFEDIIFKPTATDTIKIPELRFSISFFPLLKKELYFKRILIRDPVYTFSETHDLFLPHLNLPFNLVFKELIVSRADIQNLENNFHEIYTLHAKGKLKSHETGFLLDASLAASTTNALKVYLLGDQEKNNAYGRIKIDLSSMQPLYPLFTPPFEASLSFQAEIQGDWGYGSCKTNAELELKTLILPKIEPIEIPSIIRLDLITDKENGIAINQFSIEGNLISGKATGLFDKDLSLKEGAIAFIFHQLSFIDPLLKGSFSLEASYSPIRGFAQFSTEHLNFAEQPFEICKGQIEVVHKDGIWIGNAKSTLQQEQIHLEGITSFDYMPNRLTIHELSLQGPDILMSGDFKLQFFPWEIQGGLYACISSLNRFAKWVPDEHLGGNLALSARLNSEACSEMTFLLKNLDLSEFLAHEIKIEAKLYDFWKKAHGEISFEGERIYFPQLFFSTIFLKTFSENELWKFDLNGKGLWKDPLLFAINGHLQKELKKTTLHFENAQGLILKKELLLNHSFEISIHEKELNLSPLDLTLGEGSVLAQGYLSESFSDFSLQAKHFPLELLSFSTQEFSATGTCSLDAKICEQHCSPQGRINLLLEQVDILPSGRIVPLLAKGSLQFNLDHHILQIHSSLKATENQFFELTASLPMQGCLYPFTLDFVKDKPIFSEITMEGNLEEIFDFINIGSHKFSGLISSHLYLSKTLSNPSLIGQIELQNGTYENYLTGTYLEHIQGNAFAENHKVTLLNFSAQDSDSGKIDVKGDLLLQVQEKLPFELHAEFDHLKTLNYDSFTSYFTGPLSIKGNTEKATTEGAVIVSRANFFIPDELSEEIPVLPITYIHQPQHLKKNLVESTDLYPVALNIQLSAKNQIFVRGRGLNSEWEGNVHLGGTNQTLSANGSLRLLKGEFVFSGKVFSLTQGEITFANRNSQEAFLSLNGTLALPNATITAILRGPLSSPQLTFQSIPHMPTSSILARILFNKDISDISPFQAIQLAQAIVTLSGGAGPDVLEKIRKSLGVDRFNIVSGSSDEISIQIGKYLTRGVMVTLSQSADSSQVLVEVDLSEGFIFQAETQEEDEGKFTLKWNRNY